MPIEVKGKYAYRILQTLNEGPKTTSRISGIIHAEDLNTHSAAVEVSVHRWVHRFLDCG